MWVLTIFYDLYKVKQNLVAGLYSVQTGLKKF